MEDKEFIYIELYEEPQIGRYEREKEVYLTKTRCDVCGKKNIICMCCDGSESEYDSVSICEECSKNIFNKWVKND